jgi:hypothetical protein
VEQCLARTAEAVAQSFTLPYRRLAVGKVFEEAEAVQSRTLRYSRVKLCATLWGSALMKVPYFPDRLLAWRIIHSSVLGRESAP